MRQWSVQSILQPCLVAHSDNLPNPSVRLERKQIHSPQALEAMAAVCTPSTANVLRWSLSCGDNNNTDRTMAAAVEMNPSNNGDANTDD